MKRKILASAILAALLSTTALADTSSLGSGLDGIHGVLENDYIRAGVNSVSGSFGSGGNTSPGLLYDSTGTGTFNTSYDYLTPGAPFDGFAVKIDGTNTSNNNAGAVQWEADPSVGLTDGENTLTWYGAGADGWGITNTYSLGATSQYIDITTEIEAGTAADDVWFSRHIDPDARAAPGDSSATDNVLGYGVIPDSNVAFSEANESRYALGIYSTDSNVDAGITSPWSTQADGYTSADSACGTGITYCNGDDTIGLSWHWTGVSAGDILTANYAYIFGPSAFDAADTAITGGAGGGADTSSWGTLTDVGSATDAAESGGSSTPTVTSTSDPATSYGAWSAWAHDTDLPVLTQSQTTHDSSVAAGVQTIDRETTTIVTTPEERTRTATTTVVDTYSDGSTVTRTTGTATETETRNNAVSTVTDPGSFVGRMDQVDQLVGLNVAHGLSFAEGIKGGRTSHTMANGYSAETTAYSLGHTVVGESGVRISGGVNLADTTLKGENSTGSMSTTHFGLEVGKSLDDRDVTISASGNVANSDINYSRTIGTFTAEGETKATDTWGTLTVEKSTGAIRPWAGYTVGKRTTDGWVETGSIQAVLLATDTEKSYNYASVGLNVEAGIFDIGISKAFDDADTTTLDLGIEKHLTESIAISANANRIIAGDNESTYVSAGLRIKF